MMKVKTMVTEVLLAVTNEEIEKICTSVYKKFKQQQNKGSNNGRTGKGNSYTCADYRYQSTSADSCQIYSNILRMMIRDVMLRIACRNYRLEWNTSDIEKYRTLSFIFPENTSGFVVIATAAVFITAAVSVAAAVSVNVACVNVS